MKNFIAALTLRFVDRLSQPARSAASALGGIEKAQRMANSASAKWNQGLDELDDKLGRLANASLVTDGLGRAGEAMMRPLKSGVAAAAEFSEGMTGIGITAQMTDQQLQPMRRSIRETAREIGALPATVQAAYASVLAEGVYKTEAELTKAGRSVARFQKLAATMKDPISGDEAGGLSAGLATSFNISAAGLDQANAMLNRSGQQGGVGIGVLARRLPEQAAAMKGLGGNTDRGLADLLTANQMAKRAAGSADQGANNISNLLNTITSPETIRKFSKLGVNLEREIKAGVEQGISPLETAAALTQRMTGGAKFRIGELFGDVQASNGMMALVQNLDEFRTKSAELRGDRILQDYYADLDRAAQGPAASFGRYTSSMATASISIGTILAPAVGLAADALGRVADWMSDASENGSILAKVAVWVVAGFAAFAVGAGAVGHAVVGVLGPLFIMRTLFGTMGGAAFQMAGARIIGTLSKMRLGMMAFNLSMLANPVVLAVVAAVAAIALVAVVVRKYWEPIKAFFGGVGQALGEAFGPALSAIGSALAPLKPLWDAVSSAVGGFFGWIGRLLQPMKATQGQLDGASSAGQKFGRMLVLAFSFTPIGLFIRGIRTGINVVRAILSWRPLDTLRAAWSGVAGYFNGWRNLFSGFGRAMMQGLIGGIRAMLGEVMGAVGGVASGAVTRFKNVLGIRSPSRVFAQFGDYTMQGLAQGLTRSAGLPVGAVAAAAVAMSGAVPATAGPAFQPSAGAGGAAPAVTEIHHHHRYGDQHFHVSGEGVSIRELARELDRLRRAGQRAAINDGDLS